MFEIFRNKIVLVTGHTGFKGSWLVLWLTLLGARVYGYSLPPCTTPNHYTAAGISSILDGECIADIRDRSTLTNYILDVKPDCIFHLAAQPLVRKSYTEPVETFDANIMGSIYVMDAVRLMKKSCSVVMITSDKCYENIGKTIGYVESDAFGGQDPYSASKGCAEIAISSYRRSFFQVSDIEKHGIKLASVRAGNVIGGGDWAEDRIIPDAVRAVISGKSIELRNPNAVRPWQHVLEPLSGYLLLASKMLAGDASLADGWNFGPVASDAVTVQNLIDAFYSVWGKGHVTIDSRVNLPEAAYLTLSSEKAMRVLGWHPRWTFNETIANTANWYREFYTGKDARELSIRNINEYTGCSYEYS